MHIGEEFLDVVALDHDSIPVGNAFENDVELGLIKEMSWGV